MKIWNKKYIFSGIIVFVLIPLGIFLNKQISDRNLVKSISSLKQIYFWTIEYKNQTGENANDLPTLVEKFVELNPTDEFDDLLIDYKSGKVKFYSGSISTERLIEWEKNGKLIIINADGGVHVIDR